MFLEYLNIIILYINMSQNDNKPLYNSYCFIYLNNELVGYTHSHSEADAICKLDGRYQWDFALMIKNKEKREEYYSKLPQLICSNNNIQEN